ncbi:MAG TPA: YbfB/YjiJ family MFS transporter [Castellaniella sp.]|uniref:YbfB/YjiJ family MFS transporter n=1 Tax=Castellaniella sp. TaxID=1955812 RepID=UPI002F245F69
MHERSWVSLSLAGGVCVLLGIGLARFAYTPLIPALVDAHWFTIAQANYLGALNLLGYLIGAAIANRATLSFGSRKVLATALAVTAVSLYACLYDGGVIWYGIWRLACGVSGAVLTVVGVSAALSRVAAQHRPAASALIFSGIGLGIAASGTVVPWLIAYGIAPTWFALGSLATLLALWAWVHVWSHLEPAAGRPVPQATHAPRRWSALGLMLVLLAYGLDAVGFVPHTLFWVDYITHELGRGLTTGAIYWTAFGLGAAVGPFVAGALAHWLGFRPALVLGLLAKAGAVALPVASSAPTALLISSVLVGLLIPGTVALTSGSVMELAPPARQQQAWGWATLSFALLQAIAAYGMAWGYTDLGSYRPLFGMAAVALIIAALCAAVAARSPLPRAASETV